MIKIPLKSIMPKQSTNQKCEKQYKCDFCDKIFQSIRSMHGHKQVHTRRSFNCEYCQKNCSSESNLIEHTRSHTGERPYECLECNKTFMRKCNFTHHKNIVHSDFTSFVCEIYDKKLDQLEVYQILDPKKKSFKYNFCDKSYKYQKDVARHKKIHFDELLNCRFCKKRFITTNELKSHLLIHNDEKINKESKKIPNSKKLLNDYDRKICLESDKADTVTNEIRKHKKKSRKKAVMCKLCKKSFVQKSYLKIHLKSYCKGNLNKNSSNVEEFSISTKKISTISQNTSQKIKTHSTKNENSELQDNLFKCDHCSKIFHKKLSIAMHLKAHKFTCKHCTEIFTDNKEYELHLKSHDKKLRFKKNIKIQKSVSVIEKKLLPSKSNINNSGVTLKYSKETEANNSLVVNSKIDNQKFKLKIKKSTTSIKKSKFSTKKNASKVTSKPFVIEDSDDDCIIEELVSSKKKSSEINYEVGQETINNEIFQFRIIKIESCVEDNMENFFSSEERASSSNTAANSYVADDSNISIIEKPTVNKRLASERGILKNNSTKPNFVSKNAKSALSIANYSSIGDTDEIFIIEDSSTSKISRNISRKTVVQERTVKSENIVTIDDELYEEKYSAEITMIKEVRNNKKVKEDNHIQKEESNLTSIIKNAMKNEICQVMDNVCSNLKNEILKIFE